MHRLLLIALGVNIAFGTMCTMAFAQAAMPTQAATNDCSEQHGVMHQCSHESTGTQNHDGCSTGSCFLRVGSEVRGTERGYTIAISSFLPSLDTSDVIAPTETYLETSDIHASPPGLLSGVVMLQ